MVQGRNIDIAYALTDKIEAVTNGLEDLDNAAIVYIDLHKAFDTLNHDILIKIFISMVLGHGIISSNNFFL